MTSGQRYKKSEIYKLQTPEPLLYHASFKEFGSLVYPWHDVKLRKTQLEVSSFNPTWSRDLWGQRVIFFWKCVKLLAEQL